MSAIELTKLAYTPREFRALGGPGHTRFYELVHRGEIKLVYDGARSLILADEVRRFFDRLPTQQQANGRGRGRPRKAGAA